MQVGRPLLARTLLKDAETFDSPLPASAKTMGRTGESVRRLPSKEEYLPAEARKNEHQGIKTPGKRAEGNPKREVKEKKIRRRSTS